MDDQLFVVPYFIPQPSSFILPLPCFGGGEGFFCGFFVAPMHLDDALEFGDGAVVADGAQCRDDGIRSAVIPITVDTD